MQAGLLRMGFSRTKACRMLSERVPVGKKGTGRPSEGGRNMRTQGKDGKTHGACGGSALSGSIFCFGARGMRREENGMQGAQEGKNARR